MFNISDSDTKNLWLILVPILRF